MNGTEHKIARSNHDKTVITNASLIEILSSTSLLTITRDPPTIKYKRIGTAYDCQDSVL